MDGPELLCNISTMKMILIDRGVAVARGIISGHVALLAFNMAAGVAMAAPAPPLCATAAPFADGLHVVDAVRVVKGADGDSDFIDVKLPATTHSYFKPGELFGALDFGSATRVQIVSGPPNVKLPPHTSPGYEMFLTIQGGSAVVLPNGKRRELRPGSLVIMEDMGSKSGHGGEVGPCGYVSIQIAPTSLLVPAQP